MGNPDGAGDIEPLFLMSLLYRKSLYRRKLHSPPTVISAFLLLSDRINSALLEVSPEAVTMQKKKKAYSSQDLPPSPLFACRLITRLKSQQACKGEVQCLTHEEVCYTPKQLLEFSSLYKQKTREHVWE